MIDCFSRWPPLLFVDKITLSTIRLLYVFGCTGSEALLITNDDEVLSCGLNNSGCLGQGNNKELSAIPKSIDVLRGKNVRGFSYGGNSSGIFVVAYTETGCVYQWGKDIGKEIPMDICVPQLLHIPKKIAVVACGVEHCLALSVDGEVYSWGYGDFGQLGQALLTRYVGFLRVGGVLLDVCVINISCGSDFSIVVGDNGRVYAWGNNNCRQLGSSACTSSHSPVKINSLDDVRIKEVACGKAHVLAMTDEGELYVWGSNARFQLGLGSSEKLFTPTKNEYVEKIVGIAASFCCDTSAVMTENSEIFILGAMYGDKFCPIPKSSPYKSLHEVFAYMTTPRITYKPFIRQLEWEPINVAVEKAFDDEETSDLIIRAEGKDIHVHRAISRLRSNYFRLFLQDHWVGNDQTIVDVDRKYVVIYSYLQYLYAGKLKVDAWLALELLELAEEYQDLAVKKFCENQIKLCICTDNVASLFPLALNFNALELQKSCISFAVKHINSVVQTKTFTEWDKDTMKEFILQCQKSELFRTDNAIFILASPDENNIEQRISF
ncbi:hypothetical protein V9T40_005703 [Parthenolecanium corni]|uniref:BTB domain-containing protein n=1 Tax=Parthenolecanium corni TaxID=536013 RepID=A0AAN9YB05_9HEMI